MRDITDNFALLNLPRTPWLDPDEVQTRFRALSAAGHPDRVHSEAPSVRAEANARFSALNAACQCLAHPKERLRHLLELETGRKIDHLERLPSAAAESFFQLGSLCREVDRFLGEPASDLSPLLRLARFRQATTWREKLEAQLPALRMRVEGLEEELKNVSTAWREAPPVGSEDRAAVLPLSGLEQLFRELSYALRWSDQLQERLVQLSL
jgi:hypothetical protein